ncbi:MAG TPA: hypothetical protein VI636_25525 [Candidatus Angelobacter sp.]
MTYNEPEMIVLGDATELIKGSKGGGLDGAMMRRVDFAEEEED